MHITILYYINIIYMIIQVQYHLNIIVLTQRNRFLFSFWFLYAFILRLMNKMVDHVIIIFIPIIKYNYKYTYLNILEIIDIINAQLIKFLRKPNNTIRTHVRIIYAFIYTYNYNTIYLT